MDGLFLKIEMAEQRRDDAEAYADAIVGLTQKSCRNTLVGGSNERSRCGC